MSQLTQGDKIITIQLLTQRTEPFHDIVDSLGYFNALGNLIIIFFSYTFTSLLKNYPSFLLLFRRIAPTNLECTFSLATSIYCHNSLIETSDILAYFYAKNSVK